tara:strand:+ start:104 stop:478 length:375 start_codon:yes stop_codon:yes gene_type:complete
MKLQKTNNFIIDKNYESISVIQNKSFTNLKTCYKIFCNVYKKREMIAPEKNSQIFRWVENKKDNTINIFFTYSFLDEDNKMIKKNITSILPDIFGMLWNVQQPFLIMEEMYILKLNNQILNTNK